jgi:hypothetical protein
MDQPQLSRFWHVKPLHREFDDPCRNAKIHKILPHLYFPKAKYSLWIDGSIQIKFQGSLEELAEIYLQERDIAVFPHRTRSCAYDEAESCIKQAKDDPAVIYRQMMHYKYDNYPFSQGLAECSVILRRHTEKVRLFNEVWWNEIKTHSRRDQLSFNYVLWKLSLRYAVFPGTLAENDLFVRHPHLEPGQYPIPRPPAEPSAPVAKEPIPPPPPKPAILKRAERKIRSFRKRLFRKRETPSSTPVGLHRGQT